jgi:hypoxanthine-DNA glycosylase
VLSKLLNEPLPESIDDKKRLLISHGIALWDVIASCEIVGSADSTIKNAAANDLSLILSAADVRAIFVNGKTALKYYDKYLKEKYGREAIPLPSTSPANAAFSFDRLIEEWSVIRQYL